MEEARCRGGGGAGGARFSPHPESPGENGWGRGPWLSPSASHPRLQEHPARGLETRAGGSLILWSTPPRRAATSTLMPCVPNRSHPLHRALPAPLGRRRGAFGPEGRSLPGLSVLGGAGRSGWRPRLLMLHFSSHPRAGLGATIQGAGVSGESNLRSMSGNVRRTHLPRGVRGGGEMPASPPRRLQGPHAAREPWPPPLGPREGGATPGAGAATSAQGRGGVGGQTRPPALPGTLCSG